MGERTEDGGLDSLRRPRTVSGTGEGGPTPGHSDVSDKTDTRPRETIVGVGSGQSINPRAVSPEYSRWFSPLLVTRQNSTRCPPVGLPELIPEKGKTPRDPGTVYVPDQLQSCRVSSEYFQFTDNYDVKFSILN